MKKKPDSCQTRPGLIWAAVTILSLSTLWAGGALAEDPGSAPVPGLTIEVSTKTKTMKVVPSKRLQVSIRVKDSKGKGVPGLKLALDATAGSLKNLTDKGRGLYRASYHLPAKRFPQAVLLSAWVPGSQPGWTVIKLHSSVKLPVTTTKPRVEVTLTISGRSYGPARSDNRGQIQIPVEVRPGETEAQVNAVDEFGNRRQRTVKIPIPSAPSLVGFATRKQLAADGKDKSDIYLVAINPDGSANESLKVVAYRKTGAISPSKKVKPGLYRLWYTAPRGLKSEKTELILADKAAPKRSRRSFPFTFKVGKPARLDLTVKPDSMVADGKAEAVFVITIADDGGNMLEGLRPTLHCHRGTAVSLIELGRGKYEGRYIAPLQLAGQLSCRASLPGAASDWLEDEVSIRLIPPAPNRVEIASSSTKLAADGLSRARIDIILWDKSGNPLEGVPVTAKCGAGAIDTVSEDGQGRYHASYTAPKTQRSTKVRIEVIAGEGKAVLHEYLVLDLIYTPPPVPPLPWISVGMSGGLTTNFGRMLLGGLSLDAVARVPGTADLLYLALEGGFRYGETQDAVQAPQGTLTTELSSLPLRLLVLIKPMPKALFTPVLGLGGGVEFVQWSLSGPTGGVEREHDWLLSSLAYLGGEFHLGPGDIFLAARYSYAFLDHRSSSGSRIVGSVGGLDACLGYRMHF